MPDHDVVNTVAALLLENTPRKKGFLGIGAERVPAPTVGAAQIILASIGIAAGLRWPDRARSLIAIQPGLAVDEVLANVTKTVEAKIAAHPPAIRALQLWSFAAIDNPMLQADLWYPLDKLFPLGSVSYATGTAAGINLADSEALLNLWLNGIDRAWDSALESGLDLDGQAPNFEMLLQAVDALLTLVETGEPTGEIRAPWQVLEHIWRFEVNRIVLLAVGSIGWREPEQEKYRGILY